MEWQAISSFVVELRFRALSHDDLGEINQLPARENIALRCEMSPAGCGAARRRIFCGPIGVRAICRSGAAKIPSHRRKTGRRPPRGARPAPLQPERVSGLLTVIIHPAELLFDFQMLH
jgi:hypothetical protein